VTLSEVFQDQRGRLGRLAYRMLGSLTDAEDVVQDAWLRWSCVDIHRIDEPAAWLVRVTTRLCLDRLRAERARRKAYVGPWLPEPFVEPEVDPVDRAETVSVAFLLALQRLSPLERAVFLLHDVFDQDYATIAGALDSLRAGPEATSDPPAPGLLRHPNRQAAWPPPFSTPPLATIWPP
jgi:RNA polymerase sigma-70 factor (ECF subfamily)